MSILTKFSLKNRAALIIMILLVTILGVYSAGRLPMELFPSVDQPMINVTAFGQGLDAETMEKEVTYPMERELKNVKNLDTMTSSTSEGFIQMTLFFKTGTNLKEAGRDIEKATNQLKLPQGVDRPVVSQLNTDMIPVVQLALESENGFTKELESKIENDVLPQFQEVDGVSTAAAYGMSVTELSIKLDADKLKEKKISPQQIAMALQSQNASIPSGEVTADGKTNAVRILGTVKDVKQIQNIQLNPAAKLKDVADVKIDQFYEAETRFNQKQSLLVAINKESGANTVTVSKKIEEKIKEIREDYKSDFAMNVLMSSGEQVESSVYSMAKEVAIGALAATLIILIFLKNIRTTMIAVVSIPLSILITLFLLDLSGVSLNILTLGGLAVAVGRLVDDSIVVIENIYRRMQQEGRSLDVIVSGTKEVAVAITSSTLTTIAVFLPMIFIGGIGEFASSLVLAVVYSILASLLVALTVVPLMSYGLLKNIKPKKASPARRYIAALTWALNHKWVVAGFSLLLFIGSITAYAAIPQTNVKSEDESFVTVTMAFPANYDLNKAKNQAKEVEALLMKEEKLDDLYMNMGTDRASAQWGQATKENEATFQLGFKEGKNTDEFIERVKKLEKDYNPATLEASKMDYGSFGGGNGLEINVTAANNQDLVKSADKVMAELKKMDGLEKIKSNHEDSKQEWMIDVNQEKAMAAGLTPAQISGDIQPLLGRVPAGEMTIGDEKVQTVLSADSSDFTAKQDILDSPVYSQTAGPIPLKQLAAIEEREMKSLIYHKDGKETIQISGEIAGEDMAKIGSEISTILSKLDLPAGAKADMGGATESMQENFMDLFKIMGIAILVVYLIMVITFGQARAPFAILFSLPLAVVGGILGLIVSGTPVDINSLIGALMLIGIVVTNAIVLIERVQQNREKGMEVREALLEAGSTRLRPIIMTAITTIVAMLPLLFGSAEAGSLVSKSLAVVVIGGLTVSTALTLLVVPVMYELLNGKRKKKKHSDEETSAA
ncbi:efflux RND transporter permease subunit [Metabacillus sp. KIGAM252]|uniref:Efflux RND transporter permease subunit n=1 Tax=Metabacillus flavus TaxID=2823519 RepID=A0ABS5LBU3_9BACI|nr:efflux RND transporter permease subunit [Metabacillus flavus]MBS2968199.1 efflux RND transporter permease subunit [Metabacillus flavus]